MAEHQVDPDWSGAQTTLKDEGIEEVLEQFETAGEWDGSHAFDADAGETASWSISQGGVAGAANWHLRHATKRPPLLLRIGVVALACAVIVGLIGATIYRLRASYPVVGSQTHMSTRAAPPVITLFSPDGSPQSQGGTSAGSVAPLPLTATSAPSQYLAPDKASDYELSLIAASGAPAKAIVVSRFSQTIHVYQNGQFIAGSYAITGRPELPTPIGVYQIFLKIAPAVLYSPWPPGSPFYYPPAPVNYTMEFRAGGFLIHDAPWHHVWGPGMNGWHYDPGAQEWQWGTHGCVTAPTPFIQWLYNWSPDGTTVIIY